MIRLVLPVAGVGDRRPDPGRAGRSQRELAVADTKRVILDQDALILNGRSALVFHLRAESADPAKS